MADEVRDRREKDWTWFDDVIVDHYGPIIGAYGVAVYMVIARHSNVETQDSFPSHDTIAKKLNVSKATVKRAIALLKQEKLIAVKTRKTKVGDPDSNIYTLLRPWGGVYRNPPSNHASEPLTEDNEGVGSIGTQVGSIGTQGGVSQTPGVGSIGTPNKTYFEQDLFNKTTSIVPASSQTDATDPDTPTKSPSKKIPKSQQPGELHHNTVAAINGMVIENFHCLSNPSKLNEEFWDAQIKLISSAKVISFQDCLNSVDAYYASHPEKCPHNENSARRRMQFGITFAIEKAQKNTGGYRRYA